MFMWGGGYIGLGGFDFFGEPGLFKTPGLIQIIGLKPAFRVGNPTPKLRNSDFEATSRQGLNKVKKQAVFRI
jgi:hypothetical protein